jgi:hypothetical protein
LEYESNKMSVIQHQLAHHLLSIIRDANAIDRLLTYQIAAKELGRPIHHARAIAQVCDLLDAAAALAQIPMMALVKVRATNGEINPKAWVKDIPAGVREAIINRSLSYKFTEEDFSALEKSLFLLKGYGNLAAWKEVRNRIPDDQLYQQLSISTSIQYQDAINDLGSDKSEKEVITSSRYARDPQVRKAVKTRAKGECELCGKQGFFCPDVSIYLETHHIITLASDGSDRTTNVIALCANHHREAHFSALRDKLEKEMIKKVEKLSRASSKTNS